MQNTNMPTTKTATVAEITARNMAFLERATAPRIRPTTAELQAVSGLRTLHHIWRASNS